MKTLIAAITAAAALLLAPAAQADDPDPTTTVCTGFNLGMTPDQIAQGLQRNDGRYNIWRAYRTTLWPIIEGDCG
jgi:hypothetical protein